MFFRKIDIYVSFYKEHKESIFITGLTLEECTDTALLKAKLSEIDKQLKDLTISFKTRYVPKTRKIELKDNLDTKVAYRDMLLRQGHFFKAKRQRLKVSPEVLYGILVMGKSAVKARILYGRLL